MLRLLIRRDLIANQTCEFKQTILQFSDVDKLKQETVQRFSSLVKQQSLATTLDSYLAYNA